MYAGVQFPQLLTEALKLCFIKLFRYEYACPTPDGLALVRENGVWSLVEPAALAA